MRPHPIQLTVHDNTLAQLQALSIVQERTVDDILYDIIQPRVSLMFYVWQAWSAQIGKRSA